MSRANVRESFPTIDSRAANGESSASVCENFTFHGQTDWEMCRYTRSEIPLTSGRGTLRTGGRLGASRLGAHVDFPLTAFNIHE